MESNKEIIHIAVAFDDKFITPFYVFLTSVFDNNQHNKIVIHAIASNVKEQERTRIKDFVFGKCSEIYYYDIDDFVINDIAVIPKNSHYTAATYFRLFIPALLDKSIEKVLYIDVDTIVIGNLFDLYRIDFPSFPVAACPDMGIFGIDDVGQYFNAGVMLINLSEWRNQKITEKCINYLQNFPEKIRFADQDALNAVIKRWYKLENKFNLTFNDIPKYLPKRMYNRFLEDKVIIHYTGKDKPWLGLGRSKLRFAYHFYLMKSPRNLEQKYVDMHFNFHFLATFLKIRVKEHLNILMYYFNFYLD